MKNPIKMLQPKTVREVLDPLMKAKKGLRQVASYQFQQRDIQAARAAIASKASDEALEEAKRAQEAAARIESLLSPSTKESN